MFIADDPKNRLFNEHKKSPILSQEQLIQKYKSGDIDLSQHAQWEVIKTEHTEIFSIKMPDVSMEPNIPSGALIFFRKTNNQYSAKNQDIVLAYVAEFNAIIIREVDIQDEKLMLLPKNKILFHQTPLSAGIKVLGLAIEWRYQPR
ncbi:MAG: S24/S26 family peptidase [Proteobacteria bacterium]|nr:S24/S26 family peptidase [Pseudomonadota bacterium]